MDISNVVKNLRGQIKTAKKLAKERVNLVARLEKIDERLNAISGLGIRTGGYGKKPQTAKKPRRPRNKVTLSDAIAKVLTKDKPMAVAQIEQAVKTGGYKSSSKTFKTIIYQALAKDKRMKKAGRGKYVLKG